MVHTRARKAVGAAAALLTAASGLIVGLGAAPASADGKPTFMVEPGFARTVPVRTGGHGEAFRPVNVNIVSSGFKLTGVKVAVDASSVRGFAELNLPGNCAYSAADHLHALCAVTDWNEWGGALSVGVRATTGAVAGQQGSVIFKVTASNAVESTYKGMPPDSVGVTVGDGPDLAINDLGRSFKAPAGRTTSLPLQVTNLGSTDAKGVIVFVHDQYGRATVAGNYSNCVYESYSGGQRGAYCTFPDAVVKPGETFALKDPFALSFPAGAHGDQIQYGDGLTGDSWIGTPTGKKGTGAALTLVPVAAPAHATTADPSQDIDTNNNLYYTNLDTGITADIGAVGGSVSGTVGRVSTGTVGVRNNGNTSFSTLVNIGPGLPKGTAGVYVEFPGTVKVTSVPKVCVVELSGPDGRSDSGGGTPHAYACVTQKTLAPGQQATFTFGVEPLKVLDKAYAGVVALGPEDPTADSADNLSKLYISAVKPGTHPTAAPSASAGGTGTQSPAASASPTGGHLATTGGGSSAMPIAVAGAAALALGAGALVMTRRRRAGSRS